MSVAAELEAALGDAEPEVRRLAVRRLVEAAAEGPALLVRALADSDWRVRKEAAQTAARLPARADLVARLYAALADRERVGLRNAAVEALASLGPDVVAPGVLALDRLDADGRKLVVEVLAVVPDPRGVVALASVLRDPDPNVRAAAAEALAQATESEDDMAVVTPCLLDALADRDAGTRLAALRSLAALGVDVELERLAPHVADPLTRRAALAALGASSSPGALSLLAQSMGDAPLADAGAAAIALAAAVVGALDAGAKVDGYAAELARRPRIHERLRGFAASEDAELRGAALLLLALGRNPDDVQLIVDALGDDEVAERAELALQLFGDEVVSPLVSAAMSAPPEVRSTSLSMLPHTDVAADPEALSGLRAAARDPSSDVACAALRSLAHVGTEADVALVAELTLGPDSRSVQGARIALRELGGRFPEVARAFVVEEVARPRHPLASCTLLEVLASRGAAPPAAAHLARAATHDDALVRRAAIEALAAIGGPPAIEAATFALTDEEPEVVFAALRALGRLGQATTLADLVAQGRSPSLVAQALRALAHADPARALAAARPLLRNSDAQVASAAIEALATAGDGEHAETLFEALSHPDPEVVKVALAALARTEGDGATTGLATCLVHVAPEVRRLAAELLGQVGGVEARSLLKARLDRERDPGVQAAITRALGRGGNR